MKKNKLGGKLFVELIYGIALVMFILFAVSVLLAVSFVAYIGGHVVFATLMVGVATIIFVIWAISCGCLAKKADFADFVVAFLLLKSGCADEMKGDDASGEKQ